MGYEHLTFTIYPEKDWTPRQWHLTAFVMGQWAVHTEQLDSPMRGYHWIISHIPTGAAAFWSKDFFEAIRAAALLAEIDLPEIRVVDKDGTPKLSGVSVEVMQMTVGALIGMDVWTITDCRPEEYLRRLARKYQDTP